MADSVLGKNDTQVTKQRRWPYAVFGLVVFAALYAVIFRLPDPGMSLDYLQALIWPGLVAVVLYWLRVPLRQKVAELLKIGAFGFDAAFANNQRLQVEMTGLAAAVLEGTDDSDAHGLEGESDAAGAASDTNIEDHLTVTDQSKSETVGEPEPIPPVRGLPTVPQAAAQMAILERGLKREKEKQAIEDIMRVSAWWGYDMANLGFKTRPTPVVEWTDDGRPLIQYARGEPGRGATPDLKVMASRLEQEIRDLEAKVESPMTIQSIASMGTGDFDAMRRGDRARLRKLKSQLRTIDPDSPLGIE